ncbi:MAG: DNA alkylation repair protein [bacterium]
MVTKLSEVKDIVAKGIADPSSIFSKIKKMAQSDDWKLREVVSTILVEVSKKKPDEVVQEMKKWTTSRDPNVRRTASEGLRDIARKSPEKAISVVDKLKKDSNLYVKKSVANILRNAGRYKPEFVLNLCKKWACLKDSNTNWIINDGLRKLKISHPKETKRILDLIGK